MSGPINDRREAVGDAIIEVGESIIDRIMFWDSVGSVWPLGIVANPMLKRHLARLVKFTAAIELADLDRAMP